MVNKKLMRKINTAVLWLLAVGGLNWGLIAFFDFDLVMQLATAVNYAGLGTFIKALVGIAGVWIGILALQGKVAIKN